MFDLEAAAQSCAAWPDGGRADRLERRRRRGDRPAHPAAGRSDRGLRDRVGGTRRRTDRRPTQPGRHRRSHRRRATARPSAESLAYGVPRRGLRSEVLDDARSMKWSKLIANLAGNATSAIVRRTPAEVYADPLGYEVERRQLREAFAVIRRTRAAGPCRSGRRRPAARPRDLRLPVRLARPVSDASSAAARSQGAVAPAPADSGVGARPRSTGSTGRSPRAGADLGGVAAVNAPRRAGGRGPGRRAAAGLVRRPDRPARGEVGRRG